ncbi:DNA damage-binding protein 2-like isoform X1 [Asterias amurensis]|uniref:DNA damage-binding protein 2-like isoform X1 n=2 Tax=Asterias amurensis TaxID=7602 RepID=UPI003AB1BD78
MGTRSPGTTVFFRLLLSTQVKVIMKDHNEANGVDSGKRVLRPRKVASAVESHTPTETIKEVTVNQPTVISCNSSADENANIWKKTLAQNALKPIATNPIGLNSNSMLHRLYHRSCRSSHINKLKQAVVQLYVGQTLKNFRIQSTASPFDRRVTAMDWHPTLPKTLAIASKSGDIALWSYEKTAQVHLIKGMGKGGSVTSMTFDLDDPSGVYTASIDGTFCRQCLEGNRQNSHQVFLSTGNYSRWYCCTGVSYARKLLLAGDNVGNMTMMEKEGGKALWTKRLHKSKANHCEFNKQCDWLMVSASGDKTVRIWDVRMISDRKSALYELPHKKPINSACFSPDGTKLLTTDQHSELRIYAGPLWDRMEQSIAHPHRFFQHLTPIKGSWHPIHNLVIVGRYPDKKSPSYQEGENRTIDVIDGSSGEIVCQLLDPNVQPGIVSLNQFSPFGDSLASGMGGSVLIWTDAVKLEQIRHDKLKKTLSENGQDPGKIANPIPDLALQRRRRRRRQDDDDDIVAMKQRLKGKLARK